MARGYNAQDSYSQQQHHTPTYQQQPQQPQHYQAPKHEQYSAQKPPIPILKYDSKLNHDGSYQYSYETGNGIQAAEQGYVKNAGSKDNEIQVAEGYFQYTGDDGIPISLKYVADENGFQPQVSEMMDTCLTKDFTKNFRIVSIQSCFVEVIDTSSDCSFL